MDQLESNAGSQKQGTNGDNDNSSSRGRSKNERKSKAFPLSEVGNNGIQSICVEEFLERCCINECWNVWPKPLQMSRYSCKEFPRASQRSAELEWNMALNTFMKNSCSQPSMVLPCQQS